jgi:hypothetical protein
MSIKHNNFLTYFLFSISFKTERSLKKEGYMILEMLIIAGVSAALLKSSESSSDSSSSSCEDSSDEGREGFESFDDGSSSQSSSSNDYGLSDSAAEAFRSVMGSDD